MVFHITDNIPAPAKVSLVLSIVPTKLYFPRTIKLKKITKNKKLIIVK